MSKKVLILGGGYAGVEAALTLSKKKKKDDLEITLIDRNSYHTLLTELHEVAGNRISEDGIIVPFDRIFKYTDVKYIRDVITGYDFTNKQLKSETATYQYDYLIMAMGSKPNFYDTEGILDHAFTLWSYDDAIRIREQIKDCFIRARQENNPTVKKRLLTFTVAGAGFTGVEMIGEIAIWVKKLCKDYGISREDTRLLIVDMLPRVLSVLSEKNSRKTHRYLEKKLGVEVILDSNICGVSDKGFTAGEKFIPCSTLIWACGVCAVDDVDQMPVEKVTSNRIKVDEYCKVGHEGLYAVGDVSGFSGDQENPYPAMVENAIQTAHGAALNILNEIRGKELKPVKVKMHGVMVSVGNYYAVSEVMGKSFPSCVSIFLKFMVNIHYLWEITGFYGVAKYLYHEILERKQRKIFIEKHYSTRIQAWWLLPLRMFLGGIWLYEGLKKLGQGWLDSPKLRAFFGGADAFYENALNPSNGDWTGGVSEATAASSNAADTVAQALSTAADAVSAATEVAGGGAGSAVEVLLNWDWGWLQILAVKANDIALKIDFSPMNWMTNNMLLSSNSSQMFFQWFVVLAEIIIGICLITGSFNFIANGFSLVLMISFLMTTGLYMSQWWMILAAFALMGGAGRAFGMDYYIMPYLNNFWEKIWKARRFNPFFKRALDRYDK